MLTHIPSRILLALATLLPVSAALADDAKKDKQPGKVIDITGRGARAQYIEVGKKTQEPVKVTVGQTVRWHNRGNIPHTATSELQAGGKPLFDTGEIEAGELKDVTFTQAMFEKAGGKPGAEVKIPYVCTPHARIMKSEILLSLSAAKGDKGEPVKKP